MKIQSRQGILEMWRATVEYSFLDGEGRWGGRRGRNCVSDAEQLLTLLYPATVIPSLRVERIDETADDVLEALGGLGGGVDVPRAVLRGVTEYLREYRDGDGNPLFAGGSYYQITDDRDPEIEA